MTDSISIVATGVPASMENYQLALNAAFAGGKACGAALANAAIPQPEQEPVGEMRESAVIEGMIIPVVEIELPVGTKLYTEAPQRKPLTHEQKMALLKKHFNAQSIPSWFDAFIKDIEAAHGIKE